MKRLLILIGCFVFFAACSNSGQTITQEEQIQKEEIEKLESLSEEMESTANTIEEKESELDAALKDLEDN